MESEVPSEVLEKIKQDFDRSPSFLKRDLKGDYENIRLYGTHPNAAAFGIKCELREYVLPLLDAQSEPVVDEEGRKDFRIINIYFPDDGRPYTIYDFIKPYSSVKFVGIATTDERHDRTVFGGSYSYNALVGKILSDPENALDDKEYTVVTGKVSRGMEIIRRDEPLKKGVKAENVVEVEGVCWHRYGPNQFAFHIIPAPLSEELIKEYLE